MPYQNDRDETQIDLCIMNLKLRGFGAGEAIVLRGRTDVALGEFLLGSGFSDAGGADRPQDRQISEIQKVLTLNAGLSFWLPGSFRYENP